MTNNKIHRIKTITEFHRFRQLPKPEHSLISVINVEAAKHLHSDEPMSLALDFYMIALKRNLNDKGNVRVKYGQQQYDFDEGTLSFMAPNQIFSIALSNEAELKQSGWVILIHPDFLWNTSLAKNIKQFDFFSYAANEALFLSDKEKLRSLTLFKIFSKNIIPTLTNSAKQSSSRSWRVCSTIPKDFTIGSSSPGKNPITRSLND